MPRVEEEEEEEDAQGEIQVSYSRRRVEEVLGEAAGSDLYNFLRVGGLLRVSLTAKETALVLGG